MKTHWQINESNSGEFFVEQISEEDVSLLSSERFEEKESAFYIIEAASGKSREKVKIVDTTVEDKNL